MAGNPLQLPRKGAWLILAAVALLLAAAAGVEVFFRAAGPGGAARRRTMPKYYPPPAAVPEAPVAFSIEELLQVFSDAAAMGPAAGRFAAEVLGRPSLARLWSEFVRSRDLLALVHGLRSSPEFAELLRRFADEPGFRDAAEEVASYEPVASAIEELMSALPPPPSTPAMRPASLPAGGAQAAAASASLTAFRKGGALAAVPAITKVKEVARQGPVAPMADLASGARGARRRAAKPHTPRQEPQEIDCAQSDLRTPPGARPNKAGAPKPPVCAKPKPKPKLGLKRRPVDDPPIEQVSPGPPELGCPPEVADCEKWLYLQAQSAAFGHKDAAPGGPSTPPEEALPLPSSYGNPLSLGGDP